MLSKFEVCPTMELKFFRFLLFLFFTSLLGACEPTEEIPTTIDDITFQGGDLDAPFNSNQQSYTITASHYATELLIEISLVEGVSVEATLSTDPEGTEDDVSLDGVQYRIQLDESENLPVLTLVTSSETIAATEYSFTIERAPIDDFLQSANLASVLGMDFPGEVTSFDYDDQYIVLGMPNYDGEASDGTALTDSGSIGILSKGEDGAWEVLAIIEASNAGAGDNFGYAVSIDEKVIAVSAPNEDGDASSTAENPNDLLTDSGVIYVFIYNETSNTWEETHYIKSIFATASNFFGSAIDIWISSDSDEAEIAASSSGSVAVVEVYQRSRTETADTFGLFYQYAVTNVKGAPLLLNDDFLILGQPTFQEDVDSDAVLDDDVGRLSYHIRGADGTFDLLESGTIRYMDASVGAGSQFAYSFALYEYTLVVGSPGHNAEGIVQTYLFSDTDADDVLDAWVLEDTIEGASNSASGDRFGHSLALFGTNLVVGATGNDGDSMTNLDTVIDVTSADYVNNSGAIYTYNRVVDADTGTASWSLGAYRKSSDASADDLFGEDLFIVFDGSVFALATNGEADTATATVNTSSLYIYQ